MTKTYIEYLSPGLLFSEEDSEEVKSRDIPQKLPKSCFAFKFYDVAEKIVDGEKLTGSAKNSSGIHYIGRKYSIDEIKDLGIRGDSSSLISNLRGYGAKFGVKCHTGNWQPFLKGDKLHAKEEFEFE